MCTLLFLSKFKVRMYVWGEVPAFGVSFWEVKAGFPWLFPLAGAISHLSPHAEAVLAPFSCPIQYSSSSLPFLPCSWGVVLGRCFCPSAFRVPEDLAVFEFILFYQHRRTCMKTGSPQGSGLLRLGNGDLGWVWRHESLPKAK